MRLARKRFVGTDWREPPERKGRTNLGTNTFLGGSEDLAMLLRISLSPAKPERRWNSTDRSVRPLGSRDRRSSEAFASPQLIRIPPATRLSYSALLWIQSRPAAPSQRRLSCILWSGLGRDSAELMTFSILGPGLRPAHLRIRFKYGACHCCAQSCSMIELPF